MATGPGVFIFDSVAAALKRHVQVVEKAGCVPLPAATIEEATGMLEEEGRLEALVVAQSAAGIELARYVRDFTNLRAPLAVLVAEDESAPGAAQEEMGADAVLRQPLDPRALEAFVTLGKTLLATRNKLAQAEQSLVLVQAQASRAAPANTRTGFRRFDEIKDLLVVEVRRAKRYGYPLSVLLVGLDPSADGQPDRPSELQREITAGLAVAIAQSIRVIDLPIHYADDKILVFLPHTELDGAVEVGRRIKRRIKRITYRGEHGTAQLTASVGIAGVTAGDDLTFSKLIRNATAALKAAHLKGGDKVMKRTSSPSIQS